MGDSSYGLLSPSSIVEKCTLAGSDEVKRFENGRNVVLSVVNEESKRERDSARVHTKTLFDCKGDVQKPRLLTVHKNLIGYHMMVDSGDAIRIFNKETMARHLIKNIASPRDLQFAVHSPLIASVDIDCNLTVYKVNEDCTTEKYIEIIGWNPPEDGETHLSWCPYYPEIPNDPDDCVHMIAIYKGKSVAVLNLSSIQEELGTGTILFTEAAQVKYGVFTVIMEDRVTAACISPDSTALAVGTEQGIVSFYVVNENEMKFAHNWNPRLKTAISHLHFLDNFSDIEKKEDARFWKNCVAAGDRGRRLALFECVQWKCLGTLRFDSELDAAGFNISIDPQLRYIHILDVDGMNLFCVELDFSQELPKFSSLTQVTFCRPLQYLIPIEAFDEETDEMFPNDNDSEDENENRVNVKYIGLGSRSGVALEVHLEKATLDQFEAKEEDEDHSDIEEDISTVQLQLPSTSEMHRDEPTSSLAHYLDREELESKLLELTTKLDNLSFQVERAETERKSSTTNENLLMVLQQFKEEFSLREDRLLANVSDLIETSRAETLQAVRSALAESSQRMEALVQNSHKHAVESINIRVAEKMKESMSGLLIPQVERICGQLFKQLNETFRMGLEQYLTQFRALHSATMAAVASATPAPSVVSSDRQALLQMIKNHQIPQAFDTILNLDDQNALEFICKNVNPDEYFSKYRIPQVSILNMIQQLSFRLDSETELRFRYLPLLLDQLRVEDQHTVVSGQPILSDLLHHLQEFMNTHASASLKAQARLLVQIASMKQNQIHNILKPSLM